MASEAISIKVDGQVWYCDSLKVKQQIEGIKDKTEQKAVLESLSKGTSPLVSLDENAFVDISEMSEEDDDTVEEKSENESEIKGFDEESYDKFTREYGLKTFNTINDNSSAEEIEEALSEIEKKTEALSSEVNKLVNATKPEEIESVYAAITNIQTALNKLGTSCTNSATPKQEEESIGKKIVKGVVTLALLSNPVGWIIGGTINAANKAVEINKTKAYDSVQEKIEEAKKDLEEMRKLADENVGEAIENIAEDFTEDLADVMDENGVFDFQNTTPSMIMSNVKTINKALEGLEEYADVCEKYGISTETTESLSELVNAFKGLDGTSFAQDYVDSYAENLDLKLTGGVVCDTGNLSDLYTEVDTLIRQLESAGIDTTALQGTLETIIEENQKEAETAASEYTTSNTGDLASNITTNLESADEATNLSNNIQDSASSYDVSTSALIDESVNLTTASQQQIDDYVNSIDISGATSLAALDEMYAQINTTYQDLQDVGTMLDVSGIEGKLAEITKAKQEIIDKKQQDFEFLVNAAKTADDYQNVETKINDYISKHSGAGVDMTGISALAALATQKREALLKDSSSEENSTDKNEDYTTPNVEYITVSDNTQEEITTDPKLEQYYSDYERLKDNLEAVNITSDRLLQKIEKAAEDYFRGKDKTALNDEVNGLKDLYNYYQQEFNTNIIPNSYLSNDSDLGYLRDTFVIISERITKMDNYLG